MDNRDDKLALQLDVAFLETRPNLLDMQIGRCRHLHFFFSSSVEEDETKELRRVREDSDATINDVYDALR